MEEGVKTHPWLLAALLANGGKRRQVAIEIDEPVHTVVRWSNGEEAIPEEALPKVGILAIQLILHHEKRLRKAMADKPLIVRQKKFNSELDNLDLAHRLVFGRSLLHFLMGEIEAVK